MLFQEAEAGRKDLLYLDRIVALVWTFPGWVFSPEVTRGAALLQTTIIIATIRIVARIII